MDSKRWRWTLAPLEPWTAERDRVTLGGTVVGGAPVTLPEDLWMRSAWGTDGVLGTLAAAGVGLLDGWALAAGAVQLAGESVLVRLHVAGEREPVALLVLCPVAVRS